MIAIMLRRRLLLAWVSLFSFCFVLLMTLRVPGSYARDDGHWAERVGPQITEWMGGLMQPDTVKNGIGRSCCGEADAYWADDVHVASGHNGEKFIIVRITDTRDDAELAGRQHEELGTEYVIPPPTRSSASSNAYVGNPPDIPSSSSPDRYGSETKRSSAM
jgi:hypothetical protein